MREYSRSHSVVATNENIPRQNRFEFASESSGSENNTTSSHSSTSSGSDSASNLSGSSSSASCVGENPRPSVAPREDPVDSQQRTDNSTATRYQHQVASFPPGDLVNEASKDFATAQHRDSSGADQVPSCECASFPAPRRCSGALPTERRGAHILMEKVLDSKLTTEDCYACSENENCRDSMSDSGIRPATPRVNQQLEDTSVPERTSPLPPSPSSHSSLMLKNLTGGSHDLESTALSPSMTSPMASSEQGNPRGAPEGYFHSVPDSRCIGALESSSVASRRNCSAPSPSNCSVDSVGTRGVASLQIGAFSESCTKTSSVSTPDDSSVAFVPHSSVASGEHFGSEASELHRKPEDSIAAWSSDSALQNVSSIPTQGDATMVPQVNSDAAFETSHSSTTFVDSTAASPDSSCEFPAEESPEDVNGLDLRRTRRIAKRRREFFEFCPVCGVTVRLPELRAHFAKEVEGLARIQRNRKKPRREHKGADKNFAQVKINREHRLAAKVAQYASRAKSEVQCPACSLRISGTVQDMNKHVLYCLSQEENSDDFLVVDEDDDDESFEEYEIGNETRVRAISFVPGGYNSLQGHTKKHHPSEEDEDLNVDVDDTIAFGQPQYTEFDVIPGATLNDKEQKELLELRRAVLQNSNAQPHVLESRKWSNSEDMRETNETSRKSEDQMHLEVTAPGVILEEKEKNSDPDHIVSSLKEKIKDLEEHNKSVKCLICLEPYTKPVVSTACWHVYCEECWLMTMGVKKLCPQCNMIVSPSDLRRIYL